MYNELNEQLELGFDRSSIALPPPRPRRRRPEAGWWFEQIRQMLTTDDGPLRSRAVQGRFQFPPRRKLECTS